MDSTTKEKKEIEQEIPNFRSNNAYRHSMQVWGPYELKCVLEGMWTLILHLLQQLMIVYISVLDRWNAECNHLGDGRSVILQNRRVKRNTWISCQLLERWQVIRTPSQIECILDKIRPNYRTYAKSYPNDQPI